jgi:DinB superfamily
VCLRRSGEPLLAEVFAVIDRRHSEPLTLRDVACKIGMSPGHLTTIVRRRTRRAVQEWTVERRMAEARTPTTRACRCVHLGGFITSADDGAMSNFRAPGGAGATDALPQLAAEDYTCSRCELTYSEIPLEHAAQVIQAIPAAVRDAVFAIPERARRQRPGPRVWSVTEYVCHLRDVYATYTIRLHRVRTEDRPALEPMLNDLRARRFRYNERDVAAILDELAANAAGFCEEIASAGPQDWDRVATRLAGEQRSARWLVRQTMHEGVHHLADIRTIGTAADSSVPEP